MAPSKADNCNCALFVQGIARMTPETRPHLGITLGDPAGIGPEVILKAISTYQWQEKCQITLFGSRHILRQTQVQLQAKSEHPILNPDDLTLVDLDEGQESTILPGQSNALTGALSFGYLKAAIAQARLQQIQGIVTGPIAKSAWKQAGHPYPGQTEFLAQSADVERFGMMFVATSPHTQWQLRTLLATTHIPLRAVPTSLTPALMTLKLDLLIQTLKLDFGLPHPQIAISGLNPHSGEQGQLGQEELDWIEPWLNTMRQTYPQVTLDGLVPPDTLWVAPGLAWFGQGDHASGFQSQTHDAYLALYHDQGLIPVKLMAFDRAVNTTIGLPFIRTSPDHGTAFNIAGKGVANASSMIAAIELAIELTQKRTTL